MKPGSFTSPNNSSNTTPNENNNNSLTDNKLSKPQNIKYDISTDKVYEELGNPSCNRAVSGGPINEAISSGIAAVTSSRPSALDYNPYATAGQHSYQSSSAAASAYPYGNYMSSFGAHYGTTAAAAASYSSPYDRTSMYSYGTSPKAFVPHSAINLSVKTPELPESASSLDLSITDQAGHQNQQQQQQTAASQFSNYSGQTATGSSPQILDLTRQEAKKEILSKQEQTEPVDFSSNTSAYTYTTTSASTMAAGSFSTTESGNSSTADTLNRYRSNPVAAAGEIFFYTIIQVKENCN